MIFRQIFFIFASDEINYLCKIVKFEISKNTILYQIKYQKLFGPFLFNKQVYL